MTSEAATSPLAAVLLLLEGKALPLVSFCCFSSASACSKDGSSATASSSPLPRKEGAAVRVCVLFCADSFQCCNCTQQGALLPHQGLCRH